jgi:hypothetical protein
MHPIERRRKWGAIASTVHNKEPSTFPFPTKEYPIERNKRFLPLE